MALYNAARAFLSPLTPARASRLPGPEPVAVSLAIMGGQRHRTAPGRTADAAISPVERLHALVAADMTRDRPADPQPHGIRRRADPGPGPPPDRFRRQAASAHAHPGRRAGWRLCAATAISASPRRWSSSIPPPCCMTMWWTKARSGAARFRPIWCGATSPACWWAISSSPALSS